MSKARQIFVTSVQSLALVPKRHRLKASVQLAICAESLSKSKVEIPVNKSVVAEGELNILFIGRFLYWKGMHLGLTAFAKLVSVFPSARLTMVGRGPDEKRWRNLGDELGISDNIDWIPWLPKAELGEIYSSHDVFLFPSLHDSGGLVVLEAMTHGLPVICLDLGGPGMIVNDDCGYAISTAGKNGLQVSGDLADALIDCTANPTGRKVLGDRAKRRAHEFVPERQVQKVYSKFGN